MCATPPAQIFFITGIPDALLQVSMAFIELATTGEVEVLMPGEQHILEEDKSLVLSNLAALKGLLHVLHVA